MSEMETKALELKNEGNAAFKSGDFEKAVELFSQAISCNEADHVLYSNRSGAYASLGKFQEALDDADACIAIKSDWAKGYSRRGFALNALGNAAEAIEAYQAGLKHDAQNAACLDGLKAVASTSGADIIKEQMNLFIAKRLMTDEKVGKYVEEDSDYVRRVAGIVSQVAAMGGDLQKLQAALAMIGDERVTEGVCLVLGIPSPNATSDASAADGSASGMGSGSNNTYNGDNASTNTAASDSAGVSETMTEAEQLKQEGNAAYKARDFERAESLYRQAYEKDESNVLILNNLAAVFLERGDFEGCVKQCEEALTKARELQANYDVIAKLLNRKAACFAKQGRLEEAISTFKESLLEMNDRKTRATLRDLESALIKRKAQEYESPEKAEEHRTKGNEFFKLKKYPEAKMEYDEAIKRNPRDPKLYSNRAAAYYQLFEYPSALLDAEKAIELDPGFAKAWARKGNCHLKLKEAHKAVDAFQKGLDKDSESVECLRGLEEYRRTLYSQQGAGGKVDEEQVARAMADPEVQNILRDPQFNLILEQLQQNPQSLPQYLKDPKIAKGLEVLMGAGILRMA